MTFNWQRFCTRYGVQYVTRGPNTKAGHISVKCPMCGSADPSEHMGLSLTTAQWGCWRNAQHRGSDPTRLVQALLHCTRMHAEHVVKTFEQVQTEEFSVDALRAKLSTPQTAQPAPLRAVQLPREAHPLWWERARGAEPYLDYLRTRGLTDTWEVAWQYKLHFCRVGKYQRRILFPIEMEGVLVGWTARAIDRHVALRYDTSPNLPEGALYNEGTAYENLARPPPTALVFVEGVFDVVKLECLLPNVAAVGVLGAAISPAQITRAVALARTAKRVVCLLDPDVAHVGMRFSECLAELSGRRIINIQHLPVKDPGDLAKKHVTTVQSLIWQG